MRGRASLVGAVFATTTSVTWGGQFVVGKSALDRVNAFPLTTVRYAAAAILWLAVLAALEGRGALRLDGRGLRLLWLGSLGFAGFNLLAYTGLAHSRPQSASLIVALAPLLTALVLWRRSGRRPSKATFAFLALALAGVVLVISGGHPSTIVNGSIGWGDALVLAGVFSFVLYGLGAAQFTDFSPLRYTTLTAALGWLTIAAATAIALAAGLVPTPSGSTLAATTPQIAYLALPGAFLAVLTWNAAIGIIGPQNAVLFGNLIPVTTFAIEIVRGYRPNAVELGGAALTIVALVANNLVARRAESATAVERGYEELLEAA
ncbi:MAG TPA: DMT family transporter [Gaiellaceae bacterium]|jgi:drug/metabolite transporter (DMT)-like permease|nr:DMT family transporter [Gaiellaceae bacterium]